jgi:hypothetical protein
LHFVDSKCNKPFWPPRASDIPAANDLAIFCGSHPQRPNLKSRISNRRHHRRHGSNIAALKQSLLL